MNWLKEIARRLFYLGRRPNFDSELEDEIQFHVETRAHELAETGVARREALAQAEREFGSRVRMREQTRAAWEIQWMEDLLADVRYASRALLRNPGFAAAAIFSLALGIGANTTMFSLTMEFLFSRPSCRDPETLRSIQIGGNSAAAVRDWRFLRSAHVFADVAGSFEEAEANWRNGEDTYRLSVMPVTDNFFDMVGVPLAFGRAIQPGEQYTAVLSHGFWQRRLSGDPHVLGKALVLDGRHYTVVGVLPRDTRTLIGFGFAPELYFPVLREDEPVSLVARLPEGMTRAQAFARLQAACKELNKVHPRSQNYSWADGIRVAPVAGLERLDELGLGPFAAFFGMLMIVVGLVLLIACANVSSLLLARASSRRQELAIRLAIGAGRGRIVRQLLAESLLLAGLGTTAGLLLNIALTGWMNRVQLPVPVPIQLLIQPDRRLLAYSACVALISALAAGLMPALKATRGAVSETLKFQQGQAGNQRWTLRNALVAGQLAVSVVLLAAGFLFLRNMTKAMTMRPGFDVEHTVWAYMRLVPEKYFPSKDSGPEKARALIRDALDRLRALPGVEAASIARAVPLNDHVTIGTDFRTDRSQNPIHVDFNYNFVGPGYFKTMGIPILEGREFLASEGSSSPGVVIINENLARRLFGNASPVGRTIYWDGKPVTVAGLARNSKYFTLGEENPQALYTSYMREGGSIVNLHFVIRAFGAPQGVVRAINRTLGQLDPAAAVEVKPLRDSLGFAFLPSRVGAGLLGSMGLLGLALASIGLYGVLAYAVSRRIREIGLRIALGAGRGAIVGMIARQSLSLVILGVTTGLGIAAFATRPLAMFLVPELSPADPITFLSVAVVLLVVGLAATAGPVARAVRVDPMTALRYE
jgi:predicted permease